MKKIAIIIGVLISIAGCNKTEQPPPELIGKWESRITYLELYEDGNMIASEYDTLAENLRAVDSYSDDFRIVTNRYYPKCIGFYNMERNGEYIRITYPCLPHVDLFGKIYKLTSDSLVMEYSLENGILREYFVKL